MVMFVTSLMYRLLGTKLQCTSGHVYGITIQMLKTKLQCTLVMFVTSLTQTAGHKIAMHSGHVCDITDTDSWAQNCNALMVMSVQLSNVDFQESG